MTNYTAVSISEGFCGYRSTEAEQGVCAASVGRGCGMNRWTVAKGNQTTVLAVIRWAY